MIACCSNYLAGGELKETGKKRRRIRMLWTRSVELWELMSRRMDDARYFTSL